MAWNNHWYLRLRGNAYFYNLFFEGQDMTALQELLAKVEAGEWDWRLDWPEWDAECMPSIGLCSNAYNGSLDAAKALHEAVLPEWHFNISSEANSNGYVVALTDASWMDHSLGDDANPARAWLIAIIKALIAQEDAK
jgi:hypothetical protein